MVKKSITKRVAAMVMASVLFTCIFSIAICLFYYMQRVKTSCEDFALVISKQEAGYVDGDQIQTFLDEGDANETYNKTKDNLKILYDNGAQIAYMFVYSIRGDGVHVVFDIDTPTLEGEAPGTVLKPEQGVSSEYIKYLNGEEIPVEYSNGEYGHILTVYSRIYDSNGAVVAYAGVDIDMSSYYRQVVIVAVQVISAIFVIGLLVFFLILKYVKTYITDPIQSIVHQTERLKTISPEKWLESEEWKHQIVIDTEDELEQLNKTVNQLEESASLSMKRVIETEQELLQTKELEEVNKKLEIAVQKAEEASQAKTDFLSRMSHDMRTPLNGILNFSSFIVETDSLTEAKSYGNKILASGHYLQTLINDTLGMSRIESGKIDLKPEPYTYEEFEASIRNVLEEKAAQKGVELRFVHPEKMNQELMLDPLRLQQVCINILNNAIKFTPEGGLVSFSTERIACTETEETLRFTIVDTGIGMSRNFMEKELFKPFAQEKTGKDNEETGTGLGLSIAKKLVEIMGGSLACESEEGEGTTFTIVLTAKVADQKQKKNERKITDLSKLEGLHILLCEDHFMNREIAMKLLKNTGCIVDMASDGREGVAMFEAKSDQYDLILMDIRMPVMDGLEATRNIRKMAIAKAHTIPIIAMTANAYEDDIKECTAAGMNAHIAKPIQPNVMYLTIVENLNN